MQKIFTKSFMEENSGCYSSYGIEKLYKCSFMQVKGDVTLESIVNSEIPLNDKYWFVCKKLLTNQENQKVAIDLAEIVLPIYESKYPNDKRPRDAVEATKLFIAGHISIKELLLKRRAAADAAAAADGAAAAAAAAASYAAYAYADAADGAASAAAAAFKIDYTEKIFHYLLNLTK